MPFLMCVSNVIKIKINLIILRALVIIYIEWAALKKTTEIFQTPFTFAKVNISQKPFYIATFFRFPAEDNAQNHTHLG